MVGEDMRARRRVDGGREALPRDVRYALICVVNAAVIVSLSMRASGSWSGQSI